MHNLEDTEFPDGYGESETSVGTCDADQVVVYVLEPEYAEFLARLIETHPETDGNWQYDARMLRICAKAITLE